VMFPSVVQDDFDFLVLLTRGTTEGLCCIHTGRIELASWQCEILQMFKAEADFASDCNELRCHSIAAIPISIISVSERSR
jgi:hypothetical protein